jgi:hemoglobin
VSSPPTPPSFFDALSGAATGEGGAQAAHAIIAALVERFYDLMATVPEAGGILALHHDLPRARERLRLFLTGWMGGPQLYVERFGHPRLRARHLPFVIGPSERDQWLGCMDRAVTEVITDEPLRAALMRAFRPLAHHMMNQDG